MYMEQHGELRQPQQSEKGLLIWSELVNPYNQVFMTVNGHYSGAVHHVRQNEHGGEVIQLLINYQDSYRGGNGWLRLAEFDEAAKVISFRTYSPWIEVLADSEPLRYPDYRFLTGPYDEFNIRVDFAERFAFARG